MTYHRSDGKINCVNCGKPMIEWRAGDECVTKNRGIEKRGHVAPSSPPSNFRNTGFVHTCDGCGHWVELTRIVKHRPCPKCSTGILQPEDTEDQF